MVEQKSPAAILASLAVFRTICDSSNDVYSVIGELAVGVIVHKSLRTFSLSELTQSINHYYDFAIPESIVRTALRRLGNLTLNNHRYSVVDFNKLDPLNLSDRLEENKCKNDELMNELVQFIETHYKKKLSDIERTDLVKAFCSYMVDEPICETDAAMISAFVIENSRHDARIRQMDLIKEGVVLYSGIRYNTDLSELGSWVQKMTMFLDTEILFDFAGYNGELRKSLFDDFSNLVNDANRKTQQIELAIFETTRDEMDRYFAAAKRMLHSGEVIQPFSAMSRILSGCKTQSDVVAKQVAFWEAARRRGIKVDDYNAYSHPSNHRYNLVDASTVDLFENEIQPDEVTESLQDLTKVYIRRGGKLDGNIDTARYILVTFKNRTRQISFHPKLLEDSGVPLAVDLNYIVNKLWIKLGKGFGIGVKPKSFHAVTKAQVVLSKCLGSNVSKVFSKLISEHKAGKITTSDAAAQIMQLRKISADGEDIMADDVDAVNAALSEGDLLAYVERYDHLSVVSAQNAERAASLESTVSSLVEDLEKTSNEKREYQTRLGQVERDGIKLLLESKANALESLREHLEILETNQGKWKIRRRLAKIVHYSLLTVVSLAYIGFMIWAIFKFKWSSVAATNYVVNAIVAIAIPIIPKNMRMKFPTYRRLAVKLRISTLHWACSRSGYTPGKVSVVRQQISKLAIELEDLEAQLSEK